MPRASPADVAAVGLLLRAFPRSVVDDVLGELELHEDRRRLLPAHLVVYDVMAMGLFPHEPYEQVMRSVSAGVTWALGTTATSGFPGKVALAKARRRLGHLPLRALFEWAARTPFGPLGTPATVGGRAVATLTSRCLDLADTAANAAAFGPAANAAGGGGPRLRVVGLVESGTRVVLDAALGPPAFGVRALTASLARSLRPGDLVVLDRGCVSPRLLDAARSVGADLLWPADPMTALEPGERFADGSYLTTLHTKTSTTRPRESALVVRVIERAAGTPGPHRLMTSVVDPDALAAPALIGLAASPRGMDAVFEALNPDRGGERLAVRSKTPDGVLQEAYGLLCLYHALRHLVAAPPVARGPAAK